MVFLAVLLAALDQTIVADAPDRRGVRRHRRPG
jgi:hypothetical protein